MNLNYTIFRSEPIMTAMDLSQIRSHNKREKKAYNSNSDIDIVRTKDNIELVPLTEKYLKSFDNLTKEYKKEIDNLESKNNDLEMKNNNLLNIIYYIFQMLKKFLRKLLERGNDYTKDETSKFIKNCYDEQEFDMNDVVGISRGTTKQDELFLLHIGHIALHFVVNSKCNPFIFSYLKQFPI